VVVVVGCDANLIIKAHADLEVSWLVNESWRAGQFSSIQKGISEAIEKNNNGVIILPVDTVGISPDTVAAIIESALQNPHLDVIKPEFEGKGGHPTFLSRVFAQNLLNLDPVSAKARLDIQIRNSKSIMRLPVNDKNIISNANTSQTFETLKLEQASCAKKL
jgi:CTP:molybdopterin cytidylyltransferase MocA